MNLSEHFTTAHLIAAGRRASVPLLLFSSVWLSTNACAQTDTTEALSCHELFQLQPTRVQLHGGKDDHTYGQWWFEPSASSDTGAHTLSPTPADTERFLGAKNDSVLVRWHSTAPDASRWAQGETYLVVRAGEPILDMSGQTLGRFVRLIAKARWDERMLVEPSNGNRASNDTVGEFIAPLRIEQASEEVHLGDSVLPRRCVHIEPPQSVASSAEPTQSKARLLGLMNTATTRLIGAHNSIAIMDQGAAHGVRPEQRWALVDGATSVSRVRAQIRILQVLPQYSIVQIQNAEREALRGAYLQRLPSAAEANTP